MEIVEVDDYDFCQVCHVVGSEQLIRFTVIGVEQDIPCLICKNCCEQLAQLSKGLKE